MIYYPTVMAQYSLFVLKVPLNPKQTNKQYTSSPDCLLQNFLVTFSNTCPVLAAGLLE